MSKKTEKTKQQVVGVFGVGLDNDDGETRITRNEDVVLLGGSQETHEKLQEVSIKFNEGLKERGKRLQEAEVKEVMDILYKAIEE